MLEIDTNTVQAKQFVEFARTLPYTTVVTESKAQSFEEACVECEAVSVDAFFDELNARIEKWTEHA
jgi:hypothetical protein